MATRTLPERDATGRAQVRRPDRADESFYPRLSERQVDCVRAFGDRIELAEGDVLFEQGQRDAPFYHLLDGEADFFDSQPGGKVKVSTARPGNFIGDVAMFTGAPTLLSCVACGPATALRVQRPRLRELVARHSDIGDILLRTFLVRRDWLEQNDLGKLRLLGPAWNGATHRLRNFLERNQIPHIWTDTETDEEGWRLLHQLGIPPEQTPVIVCAEHVCRSPSVQTIAANVGLKPELCECVYDLAVVGAGPGGLAATVYGASEGLDTVVLDADSPGGQAGTSSKIENYLGFATGISGNELARQAVLQARKFGATLSNPTSVRSIRCDDADGPKEIELDDGTTLRARCVVLATGAEYTRLEADNWERFEMSGVYYAAGHPEAVQCRGTAVAVVGGGNSAGQAAVFLSQHVERVFVVIRGDDLGKSMSNYLTVRIEQAENIEVLTRTTVAAYHGGDRLESVTLETAAGRRTLELSAVFVMIGATPRTDWLAASDCVALDEHGFVLTGPAARAYDGEARPWPLDRDPHLLETTRPGIFAVGDVRSGSVKRVASAVGEGSMAVQYVHQVLATMPHPKA